MSETRRRALLYSVGLVLAAALLFAGFGITVPPDPGTRLNGAALLARLGQVDEALAECAKVLEEHPDNREARIYRATFLAMAGRNDEAVAAYDAACAQAADEPDVLRSLRADRASVLLAAGRTDEFRRALEQLRRGGADHRVDLLTGLEAAQRGAWSEATDAFRRASAAKPDDASIRSRLWNALIAQGDAALEARDFEAAQRAYDEAGPLFEHEGGPYLKSAQVCLARNDPEGALAAARRAGSDEPGVAPLVFRAATLLLERGREDAAVEALEGAYAADPEGTRVLLEREPAWESRRGNAAVKAILAGETTNSGADLTAPE